jgi:hypothetical protein
VASAAAAPEAIAAFSAAVPAAVSAVAATTGATGRAKSKRVSINPFEKKKHIWPLLLVAALAGGSGVYLAVAPAAPPTQPIAAPAVAPPAPTPATAKSAKKRASTAEDRDACVASYFPPDSFSGTPSFDFVCSDKDFREITSSLHQMVAPVIPAPSASAAPPGGTPSDLLKGDGGVKGSGLDWYELPATAIIRRHCCSAAAPLTLPESAGWCEQLQSAVRRVADDSSKAVDLAPAARAFDKAVNCLFVNKITRPYAYEKPPNDLNRAAFQQFLGRAAVSDARR